MLKLKSKGNRPYNRGVRVLELGFGGGYLLNKLLKNPEVEFVAGVDVSPEMVEFCRMLNKL